MIGYLQGIERRRMLLVERSTTQRAWLAAVAEPLVRRVGAVDRAVATLRAHPVLTAAAALAIALVARSRLLPWVARAVAVYSLLRRG